MRGDRLTREREKSYDAGFAAGLLAGQQKAWTEVYALQRRNDPETSDFPRRWVTGLSESWHWDEVTVATLDGETTTVEPTARCLHDDMPRCPKGTPGCDCP